MFNILELALRIIGIEEDTMHYDLDSIKSPDIRIQVQRLIGRSLEIPRIVRLGGPHIYRAAEDLINKSLGPIFAHLENLGLL